MADTSRFEISVGDKFSSFRELEDKIKEFSTYSFTQLGSGKFNFLFIQKPKLY